MGSLPNIVKATPEESAVLEQYLAPGELLIGYNNVLEQFAIRKPCGTVRYLKRSKGRTGLSRFFLAIIGR